MRQLRNRENRCYSTLHSKQHIVVIIIEGSTMGRISDSLRAGIAATLRSWMDPNDERAWSPVGMGLDTSSGEAVNDDTAMQLAAIYACVQKISNSIAQLPLHIYERRANGSGRDLAVRHPLYPVLHSQFNPTMTSFTARKMLCAHCELRGNAIAQISRNYAGDVAQLQPWPINQVRFETDGFTVRYFFSTKNGQKEIPANEIFHLRGLTLDGALGLSPISAARETIGEGLAAAKYASRFFRNNARPSAVIEMDGKFETSEQESRWRERFQSAQTGTNQHKVALLHKGMKYVQTGISNEDAQFLESRKFNRSEIAAIWDVPPHLIGDLEKATFSNIEQQSLEFVIYCLMPRLVNIEQQMTMQLLSAGERERYEIRFNVDGFLRGAASERWDAHWRSYMIGVRTPNEIRELEGLNPRLGGDTYWQQTNMAPEGGNPLGETNARKTEERNDAGQTEEF